MPRRRPPWWVLVVLVSCASYVLLSCYLYIWGPETPGFVYRGTPGRVVALQRGLAADRAGLRVGDTVVAIDGLTGRPAGREINRPYVGKRYELNIVRDGEPLTISWTTGRNTGAFWRDPEGLAVLGLLPDVLVSTFLAWFIALRRPNHATARLAAMLFAMSPVGSIHWLHRSDGWPMAILSLPHVVAALPVLAVLLVESLSPLMVMFYASFPRPAIRGRWIWALVSVPALYQLIASVAQLSRMLGSWVPPDVASRALFLPTRLLQIGYAFAAAGALVWNYRTLDDANARRRVRMFVAGFFVAFVPVLWHGALSLAVAYEMLTGAHPFASGVRHVDDLDARRITPAVEHGGEGSGPLDAFFARALSHDVATRPATAPDFLAGFEAAMAGAGGATSSRG